MVKLSWHSPGDLRFEVGVDRGVIYPEDGPGVPWSGLISVEETPSVTDPVSRYMDGVKYHLSMVPGSFSATIEAYTYPEELLPYTGYHLQGALYMDGQPHRLLNFSYRTGVGNDVEGVRHGHKIHFVYGALLTPSGSRYDTISDEPEASTFTWNVETAPVSVDGNRHTSHFVADTTRMAPAAIQSLYAIMYGTETTEARMPTIQELQTLAGFEPNARTETFGLTGMSDTFKWGKAVVGEDGWIYAAPYNATDILQIHPQGTSAIRSNLGMGNLTGTSKWSTFVADDTGWITAIPYNSEDTLLIDASGTTNIAIPVDLGLTGTAKWSDGVAAPNGRIYGVPYNSEDILVYNPSDATSQLKKMGVGLTGAGKWSTGILAPNRKIYCLPSRADDVLVINTFNDTAVRTDFGLDLGGGNIVSNKWGYAVITPNGFIYGIPTTEYPFLVINTNNDTAQLVDMNIPNVGFGSRLGHGVYAPDGLIYILPDGGEHGFAVVDPKTNTARMESFGMDTYPLAGGNMFGGAVLGQDNRIYGIPRSAPWVLVLEVVPPNL